MLDISVFLLTISYCTGMYFGYQIVIFISFDLYHVSIVHMHVRTLLSDDGSVVSVTRKEQQLEQTCLTICLFVVVLFCYGFILHLFLVVRVVFPLLNHYLHVWCFFFVLAIALPFLRLRLRITPLVSSNFYFTHHVLCGCVYFSNKSRCSFIIGVVV